MIAAAASTICTIRSCRYFFSPAATTTAASGCAFLANSGPPSGSASAGDIVVQLMNMPLQSRSGEGVDERGSEFIWRIGDGV